MSKNFFLGIKKKNFKKKFFWLSKKIFEVLKKTFFLSIKKKTFLGVKKNKNFFYSLYFLFNIKIYFLKKKFILAIVVVLLAIIKNEFIRK